MNSDTPETHACDVDPDCSLQPAKCLESHAGGGEIHAVGTQEGNTVTENTFIQIWEILWE